MRCLMKTLSSNREVFEDVLGPVQCQLRKKGNEPIYVLNGLLRKKTQLCLPKKHVGPPGTACYARWPCTQPLEGGVMRWLRDQLQV